MWLGSPAQKDEKGNSHAAVVTGIPRMAMELDTWLSSKDQKMVMEITNLKPRPIRIFKRCNRGTVASHAAQLALSRRMTISHVSYREIFLLCSLAAVTLISLGFAIFPSLEITPNGPFDTHHGRLGAVASESGVCTELGIDLLKLGGNAADAAVGATICVGVVGMYHSGIGGGGFAMIRSSNGTYDTVDFRETAPAAANMDMFKDRVEASLHGGLASAVPGQLAGLDYIHSRYGKLPWSEVIMPSVAIARNGFTVSGDLWKAMGLPKAHDRRRHAKPIFDHSFLTDDPAWAADFAPNGTRVGLGDVMTRQRYADTLEEIATNGIDSFYNGQFAHQIARTVGQREGIMTLEDIQTYTATSRRPVEMTFRGQRILSCGVPASGAVTLSILKTIEGYRDFTAPENVNLSTHRMTEAMRFGYGKRASFGDPDYVDDYKNLENDMLTASYADSIRRRILDDRTLNVSAYDPDGFEVGDSHGTSQITTIDASGLAISLTTTVNLYFGSHVMVPESGIILNNQMNDFSIPNVSNVFGYQPSPANYIRPFKRPLSSMAPLIAESPASSGTISVMGSAGGSRIITALAQIAMHMLLYNRTAHEAIRAPRLHDQLVPNLSAFEWGYENATVAAMREKGHDVTWLPPGYSSANAVRLFGNGSFEAAREVRQADSKAMVG
ncbi:MAG: hypothetical protein Q9222_003063 [Ikaeria aurantiellina]